MYGRIPEFEDLFFCWFELLGEPLSKDRIDELIFEWSDMTFISIINLNVGNSKKKQVEIFVTQLFGISESWG